MNGDGEEGKRTPAAEIPAERLPEGFLRDLDARERGDAVERGPPATPRPAATAVLLREAAGGGIEILLVRRARSAGFVPGAFVFPGGRVDPGDAAAPGLDHLPAGAAQALDRRLATDEGEPPGAAFLLGALRETFEETGVLPGVPAARLAEPRTDRLRERLLADELPFHRILAELDARIPDDAFAYIAHWVTPEAEPRRYDTRFFALQVSGAPAIRIHRAELAEFRWLAPKRALELHRDGRLPMIFPTVRTIEGLLGYPDPANVLSDFRSRRIPRILPRLVRTPTGVGIVVPDRS